MMMSNLHQTMAPSSRRVSVWGLVALCTLCASLLSGCAGGFDSDVAPAKISLSKMQGSVFGGRQPIAGAEIYLFAAGTTGYAGLNTSLLTTPVFTDTGGGFNLGGDYTCTAGQQMYIVATGGNPGLANNGTNPNSTIVAALGDCSTLGSSTTISMNEVTTVAAAFALAPFATSYANVGTSSSNVVGLKHAFASAAKLVNYSAGAAGGTLPVGASVNVAEINTLADILAACTNSPGGTAGDGSMCGNLFSYATPGGGTAPTDLFQAALAVARNPTHNVSLLFGGVPAQPPFSPQLSTAPNDFTLAITYTGSGLNAPVSTTVDANGQIWVANSGNNTLTVLAQTGTPIAGSPFNGNGLQMPVAVAIDTSGNGWVANKGGTTVSVFTSAGGVFGASPFTVGTAPVALAFDASGDAWVANSGSQSLSELSPSGVLLQTVATGVSAPAAIAVDPR